jgi:hypothetical protein
MPIETVETQLLTTGNRVWDWAVHRSGHRVQRLGPGNLPGRAVPYAMVLPPEVQHPRKDERAFCGDGEWYR